MLELMLTLLLLGQRPEGAFPEPYDSEPGNLTPMSPERAVQAFRLPRAFRATVFAAEPDVRNPIACAWDPRGRLWVAENYTYAERAKKFDLTLRDRVIIFEDADGDGVHDRRIVFTEDVQRLTSVEVGRGGVWLMCPPQLLFISDGDGDDQPDGPAEVVLDGFTVPAENYHNFANGLRWGPDGWLYGRCGASSPGEIGAPGTPENQRVPLRGGLWRYHPGRKVFEALTHGTTNPWGHDWDERGEAFFINTVNGHLWHAVAGMHLVRPHTIDPNPHAYEMIDQHADHWHWDTAKDWSDSRNTSPEHDRRGGGHAHSGMMIYLGDNWTPDFQGKLMTWNLHGRRMNVDRLERSGSGFVGKHEPDPIYSDDPWFRGIELTYGPGGDVFVLDWSDTGECHENTGVHRNSGRIYRVRRGDLRPPAMERLDETSGNVLVNEVAGKKEWVARMARHVLADRRGEGVDDRYWSWLAGRAVNDGNDVVRLRALWLMHATGRSDRALLVSRLSDPHESVRAWAIRLLTDDRTLDDVYGRRPKDETPIAADLLDRFVSMAALDKSGLVRLVLASTLQRLPWSQRGALAAALSRRIEDAADHNLPLMVWYGLMPVAEGDPSALAKLAAECELPTTRRLATRRLAEEIEKRPAPMDALLSLASRRPVPLQRDVLTGIAEGLKGRRKVARPDAWDTFAKTLSQSDDTALRDRIRELSVVFGDGRALDEVRELALDDKADIESRRAALESLIEARPEDLRAVCERLLKVRFLNKTAVRGLALFDDPGIGKALADNYRTFHPSERSAVLDTLVSRVTFAKALMDGIAAGKVPRDDVGAFRARQVRSLNDPSLNTRLSEAWGELRDSDADRRALIAGWKTKLTPAALESAGKSRGRAIFDKVCASCHTLYGQGKEVGPDLTGSGREDLDYLLENILDPSAVVTADYRMVVVATDDGRVLNGIVKARNDRTLTLQTQNESITLERKAIEEERPSTASLMPDGLLKDLSDEEVRDLFAYLRHKTQVPLPKP